jgi:DNA repair protein RadC
MRSTEHSPEALQQRQYRIPVYRVTLVREGSLSQLERPRITEPTAAVRILSAYLHNADREHLVALFLNAKNRIIGINTVSVGSLTASIVSPREVFKPAILANAAALILGHNHPSSDPTPSAEDRAITTRLALVGEALGIRLLDHLIIGDDTHWYSFQEAGGLSPSTPWHT